MVKYDFTQFSTDDPAINEPVFLINGYERDNYGHIYIYPVWLSRKNDKTSVKHYGDYVVNGECVFNDVQISCQYNLVEMELLKKRDPYAFHFHYTTNLGMDDMENFTLRFNFMKKVGKLFKQHCEQHGYPTSFEDYVIAVANCVGVKTFITGNRGEVDSIFYNMTEVKQYIKRLYTKGQ